MDIELHIEQYRASISADVFEGLAQFAEAQRLGGRPAHVCLKETVSDAVEAARRRDVPGYWHAIEGHQEILFRVHEARTKDLLESWTLDAHSVWDFILLHGWRRFRFADRIIHLKMKIGLDSWLFSILPNYRRENLEKLKDFLAFEERQVVIDAMEMEGFLAHGSTETLSSVLKEKAEVPAGCRHILWGTATSPSFMKLPLKKANSAHHVSDWILPLRS